jgi:uncharacterized protein YoxC
MLVEVMVGFIGVLLSIIGFFLVRTITKLDESLKEAINEIKILHTNLAVVVEQVKSHHIAISDLQQKQNELKIDVVRIQERAD